MQNNNQLFNYQFNKHFKNSVIVMGRIIWLIGPMNRFFQNFLHFIQNQTIFLSFNSSEERRL